MLTKSELLTLWGEYNFRPVKRLGQNFLIDKNIKDKILRNVNLAKDDTVIEIGPGFGELTSGLADIAKEVFAVEKDRNIARILKNALELPRNATVVEQDFLGMDIKRIAAGKKVVIYGNLPYYITTPIIEKIISNSDSIKTAYLVIQKEVAERILATPGSKDIGRLSLYAQYYTEPIKMFKITKGAFYPAPKVDSTFLRLGIRRTPKTRVRDEALFFKIIKKAYAQRRKTILSALAGDILTKDKLLKLLRNVKIDPRARAEELSLEDFTRLANSLSVF